LSVFESPAGVGCDGQADGLQSFLEGHPIIKYVNVFFLEKAAEVVVWHVLLKAVFQLAVADPYNTIKEKWPSPATETWYYRISVSGCNVIGID